MKQHIVENLVAEISDDQILTLTTDLKQVVTRTVKSNNPAACSTRGMKQLLELRNGELVPNGWTIQVNVFRKDRDGSD